MTRRIMLIGAPGAGKTTQLLTMPRPLCVFSFDNNTEAALGKADDIEIIHCLPKKFDTHIRTVEDLPKENLAAQALGEFDKMVREGIASGRWAKFKTLALDSYTLYEELLGQSITHDRGRDLLVANKGSVQKGSGPEDKRDDGKPLKSTAISVVAQLGNLGPHFVASFHVNPKSPDKPDDKTTLHAYGALRQSFPGLFDAKLFLEVKGDSSKISYKAFTRNSGTYTGLGVAFNGTPPDYEVDFTLDRSKPLEEQGLGKLLKMTGGV